jgi:sporulation protein YlmC with PRC-barrel domain
MGAFAQEKPNQGAADVIGNVPESGRINAFRADNITGSRVINLEGERIGTIDNLVIDIDTGSIVYAVLEFGGFMGFGDKLFAVPWQSLTAVPAEGIFILNESRARLEKAPGFNKADWPDIGDRGWRSGINAFYLQHAPYNQASAASPTPRQRASGHGYRPYPIYPNEVYTSIWGDPYRQMFNPAAIGTVTGEILKIEYYQQMLLLIYTDAKKPVLVALGPTGYFGSQRKVLQPGHTVTVTGSRVIVDDTPFMIATRIREGNEELQLRDKEGHPVWMAWKQTK